VLLVHQFSRLQRLRLDHVQYLGGGPRVRGEG
jgi:hypothetical protein